MRQNIYLPADASYSGSPDWRSGVAIFFIVAIFAAIIAVFLLSESPSDPEQSYQHFKEVQRRMESLK
jgi:hypothetical protein